jgi:hypothetical protein
LFPWGESGGTPKEVNGMYMCIRFYVPLGLPGSSFWFVGSREGFVTVQEQVGYSIPFPNPVLDCEYPSTTLSKLVETCSWWFCNDLILTDNRTLITKREQFLLSKTELEEGFTRVRMLVMVTNRREERRLAGVGGTGVVICFPLCTYQVYGYPICAFPNFPCAALHQQTPPWPIPHPCSRLHERPHCSSPKRHFSGSTLLW